ncbi:hypothetical protein CK203_108123 [Vitis vinifera]|uniref:Uncharacterized protein n=1 Tax=Vitis vinifera TaxID=29760 RepID=A0A438DKF5_VITVI|nr:hypothetical protein CK203_108123 [Vitis vinifera]
MRDRIELGKRQVQQSQWGSKDALNEDMSMKAKLASMARKIEEFELRNVHTEAQPQPCQLHLRECPTISNCERHVRLPSSYTSSWNNHPNLTTQPQPQPSMSTSSLEQAILKISKVMEDFVGEKEASSSTHHNLQGTNAKRSRKVLKIDTLVGIAMTTLWTNLPLKIIRFKMIKGYLNPLKHPLLQGRKRNEFPWTKWEGCQFCLGSRGIQHEVGVYDACKNRNGGETEETGEPKCISKALSGISHHEHTQCKFSHSDSAWCEKEFLYILESQASQDAIFAPQLPVQNFRTLFILVRNDFQANF